MIGYCTTTAFGVYFFKYAFKNEGMYSVFAAILGVSQLLMLMFLTDTVEYGQWKLGHRNESITFSVQPFIYKIGGAIGNGIVIGYIVYDKKFTIDKKMYDSIISELAARGEINREQE